MGGKPRCQICLGEAAVTIHEADADNPGQWHWVHYCADHDPELQEPLDQGRPAAR